MDPNLTPNQSKYSIDYLNQIAPQEKKPGLGNKLFLFIIGGGLLLAIIVGIFALTSNSNGPTQKMQTLAARLTTLKTISDKAQKNIKSGDLRSSNSSLSVFLTGANHDIVTPFANNGVDIKKIDKTILAKEAGTDLTNKLEDARLNAVYDRTYASEMGYQLQTVAALMKDIYTNTKSKSLKDFLVTTDNNLTPIKNQFKDFTQKSS
ncbi:MAG: hypothetical protein JWP06_1161 [Candidatus Saccharibacteria bacterium]|nr:hypothetical protein [Candidatus Saccharibacteria bacterium]